MGSVQLTHEELESMLDRAAKRGARAALEELGLHDDKAPKDLEDLRNILSAWKETRKAVWATVIKMVTTAVLGFIAFAVWAYTKDSVGGQ